jgi:hypothetical protein
MLSENQIREFQEIYKNSFGVEIDKEDAYRQGIKLINLLKSTISFLEKEDRKVKAQLK